MHSLLLVAAAALVLASHRRVRVGERDVAWLAGSATSPQAAQVYRRYLVRHRSHRLVGALMGVAFAVVVGVTWNGSVTFGIGGGSPFGDVLFGGLAGLMVGMLSAESFRLTEPKAGTTVGSSLLGHPMPGRSRTVVVGRVLAAVGLLVGIAVLAALGSLASLVAAVAAGIVVGVAELTRRAITDRRRPLLSPEASRVDERIRRYAWSTLAQLELAAGALAIGWATASIPGDSLGWVRLPVVLGCVIVMAVALHRARPRPPRSVRAPATTEQPEASTAEPA